MSCDARAGTDRIDRTRRTAIDAARAILSEEGWEALTQQRVAERAGLGRATVYRHWPSRVGLLHDTCAAMVMTTHTTPTGNLRDDLLKELESIRHTLIDHNMGRVVVALADRAEWEPEMMLLKQTFVGEGTSVLRSILREALERGELVDVDVDEATTLLVAPMIYRRVLSGEAVTSRLNQSMVDQLLAGHRRRP